MRLNAPPHLRTDTPYLTVHVVIFRYSSCCNLKRRSNVLKNAAEFSLLINSRRNTVNTIALTKGYILLATAFLGSVECECTVRIWGDYPETTVDMCRTITPGKISSRPDIQSQVKSITVMIRKH